MIVTKKNGKVSIYDILPEFEKTTLSKLETFFRADDGKFHMWEIAIFVPACNAYLHYMIGINDSIKNDNYMSALANMRGMIEALGAIVYDGTASLKNEAYDWFLENGRLPRLNKKGNKWIALSIDELVEYAQKVVDERIELKSIYADCCDLNHFSSKQMSFLTRFEQDTKSEGRSLKIGVSSKDYLSADEKMKFIQLTVEISYGFGYCLNEAIKEKDARSKNSK
jgi:hypothetical protein